MKHVTKIEAGIRVVSERAREPVKGTGAPGTFDELINDIDQRANYIGPVLDHLLHLEPERRFSTWRE